jgi:hypothetical protein
MSPSRRNAGGRGSRPPKPPSGRSLAGSPVGRSSNARQGASNAHQRSSTSSAPTARSFLITLRRPGCGGTPWDRLGAAIIAAAERASNLGQTGALASLLPAWRDLDAAGDLQARLGERSGRASVTRASSRADVPPWRVVMLASGCAILAAIRSWRPTGGEMHPREHTGPPAGINAGRADDLYGARISDSV